MNTISAQPIGYPLPDSPRLPDSGFGIAIAATPAASVSGSETLAVFASARLAGSHGEMYGGRLLSAARVFAVDLERGQPYFAGVENEDAVPYTAPRGDRRTLDPVRRDMISCHIAFDLRQQLRLPAERGSFAVFMWLEDELSPTLLCDIAGTQRPFSAATPPAGAGAVSFGQRKDNTAPLEPGLTLGRVQTSNQTDDRAIVAGTIGESLMRQSPRFVTVIAMDRLTKQIVWDRAALPASLLDQNECVFAIDLGVLCASAGRRTPLSASNLSLVAVCGTTRSELLQLR